MTTLVFSPHTYVARSEKHGCIFITQYSTGHCSAMRVYGSGDDSKVETLGGPAHSYRTFAEAVQACTDHIAELELMEQEARDAAAA